MPEAFISSADEWAIHKRASEVIFAQEANLGVTVHYNDNLNNYERVVEYAESLAAELCVARYFGLDFNITDNKGKKRADVGAGIEVRWTKYHSGSLIVYPNDRESDVAVLVVGKSPTYQIVGWIPVTTARKPRYKHSKQESWWVDQPNLFEMKALKESKHAYCAEPAIY